MSIFLDQIGLFIIEHLVQLTIIFKSGRAGRTGELSISNVFWSPDAPLRKDTSDPHVAEAVAVRNYLENEQQCR